MIDKAKLISTIDRALAGTDIFLVSCTVSADNVINIELDSDTSMDIDHCVAVTRAIEADFDRDTEDYELEVGSAGITSPPTLYRQFKKNIGTEVEILTKDGCKLRGTLSAAEDTDPVRFTVTTTVKARPDGAKRPVLQQVEEAFSADQCKYVRPEIKF